MGETVNDSLCSGCILETLGGRNLTEEVNKLRVNPADGRDSRRLQLLQGSVEIQEALALPRPERCIRLRQILPPVEVAGPRDLPFSICPEFHLVDMMEQTATPQDYSDAKLSL